MKSKRLNLLVWILISAILLYTIFVTALNFYLIPEIIFPKIQELISKELPEDIKLEIKDMSFNCLKGFVFRYVTLTCPVTLKDNKLFYIKEADIDLLFLPLLWKHVVLKNISLKGMNLNIGRDKNGLWNFNTLKKLDFMSDTEVSGTDFTYAIKKFSVRDASMDYMDYDQEDNLLERSFQNVNIGFRKHIRHRYTAKLSGKNVDGKGSLEVNLKYNGLSKLLKGSARLRTPYLGEYWDYYLDEILSPWHLASDDVDVKVQFSYQKKVLSLKGKYSIANAVLKYGDLSLKGDAQINQSIKYVVGQPAKDLGEIELLLQNIATATGDHIILSKGKVEAVITEKEIDIQSFTGTAGDRDINYTGSFKFAEPKELNFEGAIGNFQNNINLKLLSDNNGVLECKGTLGESFLGFNADISNLKDLAFDSKLDGKINLPDLNKLLMVDKKSVVGDIDISGGIKGEVDKLHLLQGSVLFKVTDLSLWKIDFGSFKVNTKLKDSVFSGQIPKIKFYGGVFYGDLIMDLDRWGLEFHIDKLSVKEFSEGREKMRNMDGTFTGSVAYVCEWTELDSLDGGGYIKIENADLWDAPVLEETEEAIEEVAVEKDTDAELPELERIEANFHLEDKFLVIDNLFCKAGIIAVRIAGKCSFSGESDFTAGVRFSGGGLLRMVRQVLLPVTIVIDIAADTVKAQISGQLPDDLDVNTEVQPLGWLTAFFPKVDKGNPKKYTLKKLWGKDNKKTSNDISGSKHKIGSR